MSGYSSVNLRDILENQGEQVAVDLLSSYSCPLNPDIQKFARERSVEFSKKGIAQTHLVFADDGEALRLCAFYTLAFKVLTVPLGGLSKNTVKKLSRYGVTSSDRMRIEIPAPLIAQLGKNYEDGANRLIDGDDLLNLACERVGGIQREIGGKLVYLECARTEKLIEFYERNGFRRAVSENAPEDGLIQLFRFL